MPHAALDDLIAAQQAMIAALDSQDVAAIEYNSHAVARALGQLQLDRHSNAAGDYKASLAHGLALAKAAQIRINTLSYWTRQKLDRLHALRSNHGGHMPLNTYNKSINLHK